MLLTTDGLTQISLLSRMLASECVQSNGNINGKEPIEVQEVNVYKKPQPSRFQRSHERRPGLSAVIIAKNLVIWPEIVNQNG